MSISASPFFLANPRIQSLPRSSDLAGVGSGGAVWALAGTAAIGRPNSRSINLSQEKVYLEDDIRTELNFEEIVGCSDALRHVLRQVETVAPTDWTVLIYGETGTGKN